MRSCRALADSARPQHLDLRDQRAVDDHRPARLGLEIAHRKPGLLEKLAPHAVLEIDFAADDVIGAGRAAGEIDPAGIERVRAHDTEKKGAIEAPDRRGAETVAHLRVRAAAVLPGE